MRQITQTGNTESDYDGDNESNDSDTNDNSDYNTDKQLLISDRDTDYNILEETCPYIIPNPQQDRNSNADGVKVDIDVTDSDATKLGTDVTVLFDSDTDATKLGTSDTDATKLDSDVVIIQYVNDNTTSDTTPLLSRPVKRRRQNDPTCRKRLALLKHNVHYCNDGASTESIETPPRTR